MRNQIRILFFFFCLFTKLSICQTTEIDSFKSNINYQEIDSLKQIFNNSNNSDSIRIEALISIMYEYKDNKNDSFKLVIDQLFHFSNANNSYFGLSVAYLQKAHLFYNKSEPDSSFFYKELALFNAIKANDIEFVKALHIKLSSNYFSILEYEKGLAHANQLLKIALEEENWESVGHAYNQLAYYHSRKSELEKALEYYILADSIFTKNKIESNSLGNLLRDMCDVFILSGNFEKATEYAQRAKINFEKNKNYHNLEKLVLIEGEIALNNKKFEEALVILKNSENYFGSRHGGANFLAWTQYLNGQAFLGLEDFQSATNKFESALSIEIGLADSLNMLKNLLALGQTCYYKQDYKKSSKYAQNALSLSKDIDEYLHRVDIYQLLATIYTKLNNFKTANIYLNAQIILKDSLDQVEQVKSLHNLEAKYQNKKKEDEIALLTLETQLSSKEIARKKAVQTRLIILILLLALGLSFLWYWMHSRRKIREIKFDQKMQSKNEMIDGLQYRLDKIIDNHQKISEENLVSMEELNALIQFPLSEREYDVLVSVAKGNTNGEVAKKLFISENTVKFHLKNIYNKLDVSNRVQALNRVKK